jgi:DNA mismatch repair protein MutL
VGLVKEYINVGRVQFLPDDVINHIAAGEVVERPASVVKELVENALDAQARRIQVTAQGGGIDLIQVDDDGTGMDADDATHCFQRHATSKLRTLSDLESLATMGFRGEALPSIAAVSRLQMTSRCAADMAGTRVVIEGGRVDRVETCGAPPGTSFRVADLFYNTPARRKFLKSPATESGHIVQGFTALALAATDVHMTLRLNGRLHTQAAPTKALGERLDMILGAGLQDQLLDIEHVEDDLQVTGLIARATFHRATRRQQFFFVNQRPVQSRTLSQALYDAYRTLLPRDRHPVVCVFLTLPPGEVDVNVHPAKLEVRFRRERHIYDCIRRLMMRRLQETLMGPAAPAADVSAFEATSSAARPVPMMWRTSPAVPRTFDASPAPPAPSEVPSSASGPPAAAKVDDPWREGLGFHTGYPAEGSAVLDGEPLGQLHETYLLVQYPEGVFIVDQHAAHERVVYERLIAKMQASLPESQHLLFPANIDLNGVDPDWLEACLPRLTSFGFALEPFGGRTYRLHSVPALLAERDHAAALMDVLDVLRTPNADEAPEHAATGVPSVLHRVVTVMACHGAIRAHQRLQDAEMRALLRDLARTPRPFTCPHGRPVLVNVALSDIEKTFLRR